MKIQCDVCNKDQATVFCSADEAALCSSCDHRVHHANKLAGKHPRLSLLLPSPTQTPPLCDLCQEGRAFVFCQQDRAILCRDCDVSIHTANDHTKNHNRFLLTGIKVTGFNGCDAVADPKPLSVPTETLKPSSTTNSSLKKDETTEGTSTISEYLIETLPGWQFEDFLASSAPNGFCETGVDTSSFLEDGFDSCFTPENRGVYVPQAPRPPPQMFLNSNQYPCSQISFEVNGVKEIREVSGMKAGRKLMMKKRVDDAFTVPQIRPLPSKRSRSFW